jgi:hypothetical protein
MALPFALLPHSLRAMVMCLFRTMGRGLASLGHARIPLCQENFAPGGAKQGTANLVRLHAQESFAAMMAVEARVVNALMAHH